MAATAKDAAEASQSWLLAQKIRRSIQHELDTVKKCAGDGSEIDHFKKLDELIAEYRLRCVATIWLDIESASKEKVENALWTAHVSLNSAYRKARDRLEKSQQMVTKRRVEKLYETYLKVTQKFYKAYLQRVCARYADLPELQRLVRGGVVEKMDVQERDRVNAVASGIDKPVLTTCHLTLIYLGDLGRYRSQLRQREQRNFDTALAYYRLANDLDPRSGYGYHQMGVIYLEQEKHFDIVYHFYRSLAAEQPHPNAAKNLEYEFRKVLQSAATSSGDGAYHALENWFVRLHAHFYRGEAFQQYAELENEVLHRFSLAVKAHDFVDGLLKMCLVNICAYQVAKDKIAAGWTPEGSQSCQFTLRLNIRTICAILRHLAPELVDLVELMRTSSCQPIGTGQTAGADTNGKFNAVISDALPILRVYMTWLCQYRSDIVQFGPHLQPYIGDMYMILSGVLSSLFEVLGHYPRLEPVPYLFREDIETLGLKALSGPELPAACRLEIDSITREPKSRPEETSNLDFKPDDISFTRSLDITTCGVVLADEPELPLAISYSPVGPQFAAVTYLAEGKPPSRAQTASAVAADYASPSTAAAELSITLGIRPSPTVATTEQTAARMPAKEPEPASAMNGLMQALAAQEEQRGPVPVGPVVSTNAPRLAEESDYAVDHDSVMNDLVNGLVEPTESDSLEPGSRQEETSYGMHTETARDVFGSAVPSTSPGLTPNQNGFPTLPWSWDPFVKPALHQQEISSKSPRSPWARASGSPQPVSNRSSTSAVPSYSINKSNNPSITGSVAEQANDYHLVADSTPSSVQPAWLQGRQHGSGIQGTTSAAGVIGQSLYGSAADIHNPWSQGISKFSSIQDILGAQLKALAPPGMQHSASPTTSANPVVPSSFASTTFSGNTSSLPPANSPWGLPNKVAGGSGNPGPISRPTPPGFSPNQGPNSNGNVGRLPVRREDNSVPYKPHGTSANSRPVSTMTPPSLKPDAIYGNANGLLTLEENQNASLEALLRKLRDSTKPNS